MISWFTSGEGCFLISILKSSTCKIGKAVIKFKIAQHSIDTELMKILISTLGCGRIELNLAKSAVYFLVTKYQDIVDKVIPFFDKYLKGVKVSDYSDFKKVAILITKLT